MHARKKTLMRFARSRWGLTTLSALLAVVLITSISLRAMSIHASSPFVGKFIDDNPKLGENGRLDQSFQEYANRAYPASEVPLQASQNAQAAFNQVQQRGHSDNAGGSWSLIGPSTANFPSTLTFTGAPYTTSGRITALALNPACSKSGDDESEDSRCRLFVAAAGGGVWRTDNPFASHPHWTFTSMSFGTNAIGTLTYATGTLYAGTGEPNASGDSEAGVGIYKSTDNGETWTHLASITTTSSLANGTYTGDAFAGRSISSIVVDPTNPDTVYVASTRGVRGVGSTGGAISTPPGPRPPIGLFKSTDGGAHFTFIWDGNTSIRGVNHAELDPSSSSIVYAAAFQQGIWRSLDGGTTWAQIKTPRNPALNTDRAEFAVTKLSNGKTRMYAGIGNSSTTSANRAHFFRTDDAAGAAVFVDMTKTQNVNYCTAQCWYDNLVVTPAGHPDTVYLAGSYQYAEIPNLQPFDGSSGVSNGRAVLYSTDGGTNFTDMTMDATSASKPNGLHPDQHALVVNPSKPTQFFEGSDGGLVRSSGDFTNVSSQCAARGVPAGSLANCQELLSRVPSRLTGLNTGLSTLQFQSVSVARDDANHVQGGTQDNGTFENQGSSQVWPQIIYGDGGQSGFNAKNSALRFNTFTGQANDANFHNGDPTKWVIISGPILSGPENSFFYPPVIADPNKATAGSIFQGSQSVWRTQDWGGNQAFLEANCPEFTASASDPNCGDFVQIGPAGATDLTSSAYGADRVSNVACLTVSQGCVSALARTASDTKTLWAATGFGRVFISTNANDPAGSVKFTRLDSLAANSPGRFVSSIYVDPHNSNHAWISYSGYNVNTPTTPGHVFEVTYNPSGAGSATWTNLDGGSGPMGDLPVTSVVRDDVTGDLYASTDFGVMTLPHGSTTWVRAGDGLPNVEVSSLTIVPGARVLYAATHGRSVWKLDLGGGDNGANNGGNNGG